MKVLVESSDLADLMAKSHVACFLAKEILDNCNHNMGITAWANKLLSILTISDETIGKINCYDDKTGLPIE